MAVFKYFNQLSQETINKTYSKTNIQKTKNAFITCLAIFLKNLTTKKFLLNLCFYQTLYTYFQTSKSNTIKFNICFKKQLMK